VIFPIERPPADVGDYLRKAERLRDMPTQRTGADESLTLRLGKNLTYHLRRGHNPTGTRPSTL
jgi:hypothetical protein